MRTRIVIFSIASFCLSLSAVGYAQSLDNAAFANFKWRLVGPFRGGRATAVAGSKARPAEFYFGATGGGIWKSTDSGENWNCVSDGFLTTASVGALSVAESNPDIVWAGTGEGCVRGDISHGDGIYKSTDGGKTWDHMGLKETQTITRVRIHPTNHDIVYVAALGHIYGSNKERGVYKTSDGGRTWQLALFVSDRAGAVDLCMDAHDPETLYASTWEIFRTPYSLSSGGEGSRIYKTTDGGKNWKDISRNPGLPNGTLGRIGIAVSPADSKIVYACVENLEGGIFRSDDGGATWKLTNNNRNYRQRAWYYTHIYADPKNADTVYILNVGAARSVDGGKTFTGLGTPHSDNHDLWLNPENPQIMIESNDGGANVSKDGGRSWSEQDVPTGQFYHVTTDNSFPYRIYGAQQDNSSIRIASRTFTVGIGRADWSGTAGGESGYIAVKPDDPDIVYGGNYSGDLSMINYRTGENRAADPWPDNPMGHGAIDSVQRFQWTYPIVFSPNDPNILYTCSQFVLKTLDGGQSWIKISQDLTRNDPATLGSSGGPITKDNTGVEVYGTVFTMAESPVKKGVLWAGSDDGLVHVTRDGGKNWTDVTPKRMPKWGLCSMIEASPHDAASAYLATDNHENNDLAPYIYVTHDYGKTWDLRTVGIPKEWFARVVREDPKRKGLLYAGTERGVFVSWDDGKRWTSLQQNLPLCPVHDLTIKEDDLVAATHGRAFWILDDISPLRQMDDAKLASGNAFLFNPRPANGASGGGFGGRGGRRGGGAPQPTVTEQLGENPMRGLIIGYFLKSKADSVEIEMLDAKGAVIGRSSGASTSPGFQRTSLSIVNYPGFRNFPGNIMWAAGARSLPVPPGIYKVHFKAKGADWTYEADTTAHWMKDPRWTATEKELQEKTRFAMEISERVNAAHDAIVQIRNLRDDIDKASTDAKDPAIDTAGTKLKALVTAIEEELYQTKNRVGQDPLNYPIKLNNKLAALQGVVLSNDFGPTKQSYEVFEMLNKQLKVQLDALKRIVDKDLADYNKLIVAKGQKALTLHGQAQAGGGGGRFGEEEEIDP